MAKADDYLNEIISNLNQISEFKRKIVLRAMIDKLLHESFLTQASRFDIINGVIDDTTRIIPKRSQTPDMGADGRTYKQGEKQKESSSIQAEPSEKV